MKQRNKDTHYRALALYYTNSVRLLRYTAAVHVEAIPDEFFWRKVLAYTRPKERFYFITYSKTKDDKKATGCEVCLKYKKLKCLSNKFFICIDSDYRYLLGEKDINPQNFVFQTYTYSIENHWCYTEGINEAFEKAGLHNTIFDFDRFLFEYSGILYELFLYHLHSLSVRDKFFPKEKFKRFLNISNPAASSDIILDKIKQHIDVQLALLKENYNNISIEDLKEKYSGLGLRKENAYLYFRGHNVFEQVVLKIAIEVKERLQREQAEQLTGENKHIYYNNRKKEDFISYFSEDLCFEKYPEIKKIETDIYKHFKKN